MIVCSCDPDTKTPAFAIFNGRKLSGWKILRGDTPRMLPEVKSIIEFWKPELLVIENQYLPARRGALRLFRSVSSLVSARAMITAVFILSGIDCQIVEPFAWQKALGGSALGRDQLKGLSILKATEISGSKIEDHNIADAINIGFWWVSEQACLGGGTTAEGASSGGRTLRDDPSTAKQLERG